MTSTATQSTQSTPLASTAGAMGKPEPLTLRGKTYRVEPADLNDLGDLEDVIGGLGGLNPSRPRHMRALLWLALRKADERLTPEQRKRQEYPLTEEEVGAMFPAGAMLAEETLAFVNRFLEMSEMVTPEAGPEGAGGNAPGKASA